MASGDINTQNWEGIPEIAFVRQLQSIIQAFLFKAYQFIKHICCSYTQCIIMIGITLRGLSCLVSVIWSFRKAAEVRDWLFIILTGLWNSNRIYNHGWGEKHEWQLVTPITISSQLYILDWRSSRTQTVFPSLSHAVMLQPAALRVAGGRSRQGAEIQQRLNQCLAHTPPTLYLSIHPFLSFIQSLTLSSSVLFPAHSLPT